MHSSSSSEPAWSPAMVWQQDGWRFVEGSLRAGRLPHALLIGGERGVGKQAFADAIAGLLLCDQVFRQIANGESEQERLLPCGHCKQCELLKADSHPDMRRYAPEKSRMIKVDQVRALSAFAVASPQVAQRKVIIIDRADQLNVNAANALLKTLEEPSSDVMLLLLQESGRPILPTLRSRCQTVVIPTPDFDTASQWLVAQLEAGALQAGSEAAERPSAELCEKALHLAGSAPRLALEYLSGDFLDQRRNALDSFRRFMKNELSLPEAAKPFKSMGLDAMLWLMDSWAADLARLSVGGEARDTDARDMLRYLASVNPAWKAHELLAEFREARAAGIYNVSAELEAERLLMLWQALMPRKRRAG